VTLRHAATAVGLVLASLVLASPAEAGGSWPSPVKDRYEPGEDVTIIGFTGMDPAGQFFGWLRVDPDAAHQPQVPDTWPFVHPTDLPLGPVLVEHRSGQNDWAAWRVSLSFRLPPDLPPAAYEVIFCDDPCTKGLGDVVGAVVHVGVDPETPPVRDWPLDDPAIALLEPDAKLWYVGEGDMSQTVTAEQVRSGELPPPARLRARLDDIADVAIEDITTTAPEPPGEDDADVRLTEGDSDEDARSPAAAPWLAAAAGAVALFIAVQAFGPGRKHVQHGPERSPLAPSSGGQTARRKARWPRRVVRP
jgi:hypothetical protein